MPNINGGRSAQGSGAGGAGLGTGLSREVGGEKGGGGGGGGGGGWFLPEESVGYVVHCSLLSLFALLCINVQV